MKLKPNPRCGWLLGMFCWLLAGGAFAADRSAVVGEYQVKAVMVYNFTKFAQWPTNAFTSATAPLVIGILGEDPFGHTMEEGIGETDNGRPIQVRRLAGDDELRGCHIVFISQSEKSRLKAILALVRDRPILTISETGGFGQAGGIVNFVTVDETIHFEINAGAAQRAGIKISSKLLNLPKAIKVETQKE